MSTSHTKPEQEPEGHLQGLVRMVCGLFAAFLLFYGVRGIYRDDLFVPTRRGNGIHFHGLPAWMAAAGLFCFAASLISVLIRSFVSPPNRPGYRIFIKWMKYLGTGLFLGAFVVVILSTHKK
jgi:hypothetical protein